MTQGPGCTSKKKGCKTCKGCTNHPLDHSEYYVKMVLCHVYATLTQPCWSFSKKMVSSKKKSLFQSFSLEIK